MQQDAQKIEIPQQPDQAIILLLYPFRGRKSKRMWAFGHLNNPRYAGARGTQRFA